jgi:CPA1 family monovalent cation:H+ antiporter
VDVALTIVTLVAVVITVSAASSRLDLPAPLVLIPVGIAASFVPFVPELELSADVVLMGFLPPLLYGAALQTSLVDFNANRRPILLLSIGLVLFTTAGVALVVHAVLPGASWAASFAIGAVVAPPDAVAATAIARRIGLPRRLVTILEGESLLNDATALVALRTAIAAASGAVSLTSVAFDFALAAVGGVVVGLVVFVVVGWVRRHFTEVVFDTGVSLLTPFAAFLAAEVIHASGVLAVVVAGLLLGHKAPVLQSARSRISERVNWRAITFLLENTIFLLIGLQARRIIEDVSASELSLGTIITVCAATLGATVLLRPVWVFPARYFLVRPGPDPVSGQAPPWTYTTVLSWAGMRGVVTLAAAFALPPSFADREVLLLVAFTVTAGTLLLQGATLPWLVRRLRVPSPGAHEDALARAELFHSASQAGIQELERHVGEDDPHDTIDSLRRRAEERDFAEWEQLGRDDADDETPSEAFARMRLMMLNAERAKVLDVRSTGQVAHQVVEEVLAALDVEESVLGAVSDRQREKREVSGQMETEGSGSGSGPPCEELEQAPEDTEPNTTEGCEDCMREGTRWVHLRFCLDCGHVGCCDSSPRRHADAHHRESSHPVIRSAEPGETWRWCYVHSRVG